MRDALGRVQRILLLGGGSEIGRAIVLELLRDGPAAVVLAARDPERLDVAALEAAGAAVERVAFDAVDTGAHAAVFESVFSAGSDVDVVIVAFGLLGDQQAGERDAAAALAVAATNYTGAVSALTHAAARLREQGHGSIVVLSSVAAERARRSNFIYGSSKAGVDAYSSGLQLALAGSGVDLLIVRPGFVRTAMTVGLKAAPFAVGPDAVGKATVEGLRRGAAVVWVPAILRYVMSFIRLLPRRALQRL